MNKTTMKCELVFTSRGGIFCTKCEIQIKATQKEILRIRRIRRTSKDNYVKAYEKKFQEVY